MGFMEMIVSKLILPEQLFCMDVIIFSFIYHFTMLVMEHYKGGISYFFG